MTSTRVVCLLAALLVAAGLAPALAQAAEPPRTLLVTLADDGAAYARAHGGRVLAPGIVAVPEAAAAGGANVLSIEADAPVRAATASWATASWDTASWDTASWDTASWDTASWATASWATASWAQAGDANASDAQWGARAIHADAGMRAGAPALVCIIDSGIDARHPSLAGHVAAGIDLVRGDDEPDDEAGHGTHMAGIIAADEGPMRGVSNARIASAKILDAHGVGATSDLVAALSWCAGQRADVILMALSEDTPTQALARAIRDAASEGRVLVASAGNTGPCADCVTYPASDPHVVAVGSVGRTLARSPFSAAGRALDLALPGEGIVSTVPGGGFRAGSGTSQAAAFAAGAIAAIQASGGQGKATLALDKIQRTAHDLGAPGRDPETGRGIPDLVQALGRK